MSKFYVYVLLDQRKPGDYRYGKWKFDYEPFYIGKGEGDRAICHFRAVANNNVTHINYNKLKAKRIEHILRDTGEAPLICYKRKNLSEDAAYELEASLIERVGRIRYGGPLLNLSAGGRGNSGVIRGATPDEVKKKISAGIKKTFAEKPPEFHQAVMENRLATVAARQGTKRQSEISTKFRETSREYWDSPAGMEERKQCAIRATRIRKEWYATASALDIAKLRYRQRVGHFVNRLTLPKKKVDNIKSNLLEFVENSRHRSPERFKAASDALISEYRAKYA